MNTDKLTIPPAFSLEIKPFWNKDCQLLQAFCFLPFTKDKKKNFITEKVHPLIEQVTPIRFYANPFSLVHTSNVYSPDQTVTVKITRKVRLYFQHAEQKRKYTEMMAVYRRAYNLSVDLYVNGKNKLEDGSYINDIRPLIRAQIKSECEKTGSVYDVNVIDEACKEAKKCFLTVCKNNKQIKTNQVGSSYQELGFKSKKNKVQSFSHHKLGQKGVCASALGQICLTEKLPPEAYGKTVRVICDHNRWFIAVLKLETLSIESQERESNSFKMIALDLGSRNFLTGFSQNTAFFMGKGFSVEKLLPLAKEMRVLFSERRKLQKLPENALESEKKPQWFNDSLSAINKQLDRLEWQRQDRVKRLHHECADFLVKNFDIILLPTFRTSEMVKRSSQRALNRAAVHNMLSLKHHEFKTFLLWKALKHNKKVILVDESYTSKTVSWTGQIKENLKGKKTICADGISVDRDINGARNIYIKHLMFIFHYSKKPIGHKIENFLSRGLAPHSEQQTQ